MYGNVFEEEERVQRQAVFPRLLCNNAHDFSLVSLSPTLRPWLTGCLHVWKSFQTFLMTADNEVGTELGAGCLRDFISLMNKRTGLCCFALMNVLDCWRSNRVWERLGRNLDCSKWNLEVAGVPVPIKRWGHICQSMFENGKCYRDQDVLGDLWQHTSSSTHDGISSTHPQGQYQWYFTIVLDIFDACSSLPCVLQVEPNHNKYIHRKQLWHPLQTPLKMTLLNKRSTHSKTGEFWHLCLAY